jgi:hypothetical protein
MTSGQMRAARAMLRWEQKTLAEVSQVSLATIKRLEAQTGELEANKPTLEAIRLALEAAGIQFTNGGEPGVKQRRPEAP